MKKERIVACCHSADYRCTDSGRIINKYGRPLVGSVQNGYTRYTLRIDKKSKSVNAGATVWQSFHGTIPQGYEVDHINGDRSDNRLSNLRIVTHKQNMNNPITRDRLSKPRKRYSITYEKIK